MGVKYFHTRMKKLTAQQVTISRKLRSTLTDAEQLLWHHLRHKQVAGIKFRRQHPIGRYVVDFACLSKKLAIEVDGGQHAEMKSQDAQRDAFLQQKGFRVLRFWNNEILGNIEGVMERIWTAVSGK
jgi:very-short-patch-repair endonuclease